MSDVSDQIAILNAQIDLYNAQISAANSQASSQVAQINKGAALKIAQVTKQINDAQYRIDELNNQSNA